VKLIDNYMPVILSSETMFLRLAHANKLCPPTCPLCKADIAFREASKELDTIMRLDRELK